MGSLLALFLPGISLAATPPWGTAVTGLVVFDADLVATAPDVSTEFYGVVIGADGTTIDLNGFSIDGAGLGGGIYNPGFDNVTVKNGTIIRDGDGVWFDGFNARSYPGGESDGIDDAIVENVLFKDQAFNGVISPPSEAALWCDDCKGLVFRDNEIDNGGWLWMLANDGGMITGNHWHDNNQTAILLWQQTNVVIEKNLFERVNLAPPNFGPSGFGEDGVIGTATGTDGLLIRRNVIRDSGAGSAGPIVTGGTSAGLPAIGVRHRDAATTNPADNVATVEENCITGNAHGGIQQFDGKGAQTVEAHGNDLIGNGSSNPSGEDYGVKLFNDRTNALVMNAEDNFWGDASGPVSDGAGPGNDAITAGTGPMTLVATPFATAALGPCADRDSSGVPDIVECGARYVAAAGSDGGNACLSAADPCLTIQHAVDEACSDDTVNVGAGSYEEQVRIDKGLTLAGAGSGTTTILAPAKASRVTEDADHGFGLRTYDYLVGVFGTGVETVNISGFTLEGNNDAKSSGPGTFRSQQLTFFNANGAITDNVLSNWQDPAAFGAQGVATLVVGSLTPVTVDVLSNVVDGYQKGGIVAFGSAANVVTIEGNSVTGAGAITSTAQNGIQLSFGAIGSVVGNDVSGNDFTPLSFCSAGILVVASDGVEVRNNTLSGNLCDILAITNDSTLAGNEIAAALEFPFSVLGNTNTVDKNYVNGSPFDAVYVDGTDNVLTCNRLTNNGGAGVFFDSTNGFGTTDGTPNSATDSTIAGNASGIDASLVTVLPPIDGSRNFWGCPTGANTPGCDTAVGNVDFTPSVSSEPPCVTCAGAGGDSDDDGICNPVDNCPVDANVGQEDADADGLGDVCDSCPLAVDNDIDGDTVCDDADNCPADANSDQADVDEDGLGNVCDSDDGPGTLTLSQARVKADNPATPAANGKLRILALLSDAATGARLPEDLTQNGDVQLAVTAGDFSSTIALSTCNQINPKKIVCKSGNVRAIFRLVTVGINVSPGNYRVKVLQKKIGDADDPTGPVTLSLRQPTPDIDRSDDISACRTRPRRLSCRER